MRIIRIKLDDELMEAVDLVVKQLKTTRSAFTRKALKDAIEQVNVELLENKHLDGYVRYPVGETEFNFLR